MFDKNPPTIADLQRELYAWECYNFGRQPIEPKILGICEEAGELCHAILKMSQGIRGSKEEHLEAAKDAIGDVTIYALNLASTRRIVIQDLPQEGDRGGEGLYVGAMRVSYFAGMMADIGLQEHAQGGCLGIGQINWALQHIFASLGQMATLIDEPYEKIVFDTYRHVTRRNWLENKKDGGA